MQFHFFEFRNAKFILENCKSFEMLKGIERPWKMCIVELFHMDLRNNKKNSK
jgi:hypothetical protein